MTIHSSGVRRELEGFKQLTSKLSQKINSVGNIWSDGNYNILHSRISELAKESRHVVDNGDRACVSIDRFFTIAEETVRER